MVDTAAIKKDLPNFPDEVIEEWLVYFANEKDMGWPPPEPFGDHRWGRLLGHRAVSWWAEVVWALEVVDCSFDKLCPAVRSRIEETIREALSPTGNPIEKKRYNEAMRYIMDEGAFPNAMTAMRKADGLNIIDGYHRMAAFQSLVRAPDSAFKKLGRERASMAQPMWIGAHPRGEHPSA